MTTPRESEIRAALIANLGKTHRQVAALLGIRCWSKVRLVAEAMAAEAAALPPEPPQLLAPDVPAASDLTSPRLLVTPNPTVTCQNCHREGTPAPDRPEWCKACAAGGDAYRAAWPRPELSPAAASAMELIASFAGDQAAVTFLRRRYLVARAVDYGILEA